MGASGSSTSRAKLLVPAGGSVQLRCGETSAASQVNFLGMAPPLVKLGLEMVRDIGCSAGIKDSAKVGVREGIGQSAMMAVAARSTSVLDALKGRVRVCRSDFKLALRARIQLVEMVKLTVILA